MLKFHKRGRRERGQTLILVTLALPLFFALMSLVVDGGNILVHKRNIQVAADAAALAAARDLASRGVGPCDATCLASVQSSAQDYSQKNGGTNNLPQCSSTVTTNCFVTPFQGHDDQVEVRLTQHVTTFLAGMIGIYSANVSARAVASGSAIFGTTTVPGTVIHGTTFVVTVPGGTHTTTDPDQLSGGSGVAFTMSRVCDSISYTGDGSGTQVLGAFATNGGVFLNGNKPKKMTWLAYNRAGCPNNPPSPPSGTNQCTSTDPSWGDATDSNNLCVKTLVNLNGPINWPITPPNPPTPRTGVWNASADFGTNCIDLGSGNVSFSTAGHLPGVYCVNGPGATLTINSVGDLTTGDGYTFFALGGGTISVSGNTNKLKFYWPSACGPGTRPTTRASSYPCPGLSRTISGYDPFTLFYATNPSTPVGTPPTQPCAICLQGQSNELTGDIFAPKPDVFPPLPGPTQLGGLVKINGGSLSAGTGFIESWNLQIAGNTGSYRGTGTSLVIPGQTHTTTDPSSTITTVAPDTTSPSTVEVTTIGTGIQLNQ